MGSAPTNRVLWPSLVVSPGHIEATWETQESVVAIPDPIHTCKDGNNNNLGGIWWLGLSAVFDVILIHLDLDDFRCRFIL